MKNKVLTLFLLSIFTIHQAIANTLEENVRDGFIESSSKSCYQSQRSDHTNNSVTNSLLSNYCNCYAKMTWSKLNQDDLLIMQSFVNSKQPATNLPNEIQTKFQEAGKECIILSFKK